MKRTIFIDASSLKHISCFRKFYRMVVKGYKTKDSYKSDVPMAYGSAIHKFLEGYYNCLPVMDCIKMATDYYKPFSENVGFSPREFRYTENLIKCCVAYKDKYPRLKNETDDIITHHNDFQPHLNEKDKRTVEYKFAITIYENEFYILVLTGTVDLVCSYSGIDLLLVDHKSSSSSAEYSDNFFDDYVLDIQTMLYSKVYKESLKLDYYPMVLINGIFVSKPTKKAEAEGVFDGVEFKRSSPISYSAEQMEAFNFWYDMQIKLIIDQIESNFLYAELGYNLTQCKAGYNNSHKCQYFDVCKLPKKFHDSALQNNFTTKIYNPLEFR